MALVRAGRAAREPRAPCGLSARSARRDRITRAAGGIVPCTRMVAEAARAGTSGGDMAAMTWRRRAATVAAVVAGALPALPAAPAAAATPSSLGGCAFKEMCVVDGDRIVYNAFGSATSWPSAADNRADRIVNNGSAYDLVVYEHAAAGGAPDAGWALCVPRGQVVGLAGLKPAVADQASSHRWVAGDTCGGRVSWLRAPGAAATGAATGGSSSRFVARAVEVARGQLGVREVPHNKGRRVTEYQRSVRDDRTAIGQPWCASFLTWVFVQAGDPTPLRSAVVADWVRAALDGRAGLSTVAWDDVRVGDLVAFKKAGGWQHMGIVSSTRNGIVVLSANTTAPDKKADGVFEKPVTNWTRLGYSVAFLRNAA